MYHIVYNLSRKYIRPGSIGYSPASGYIRHCHKNVSNVLEDIYNLKDKYFSMVISSDLKSEIEALMSILHFIPFIDGPFSDVPLETSIYVGVYGKWCTHIATH